MGSTWKGSLSAEDTGVGQIKRKGGTGTLSTSLCSRKGIGQEVETLSFLLPFLEITTYDF